MNLTHNEPGAIYVEDSNGGWTTTLYLCYPQMPAITERDALWKIKRVVMTRTLGGSEQVVQVGYPNGLTSYSFCPDKRGEYNYLFANP